MNIEPYVVSLPIAKELKEAGYPQEDCLFYWHTTNGDIESLATIISSVSQTQRNSLLWEHLYAAPISDELLDKLPEKYDMCFGVEGYIYLCGKRKKYIFDKETNRPDAIAELWLRAKKDGFL